MLIKTIRRSLLISLRFLMTCMRDYFNSFQEKLVVDCIARSEKVFAFTYMSYNVYLFSIFGQYLQSIIIFVLVYFRWFYIFLFAIIDRRPV